MIRMSCAVPTAGAICRRDGGQAGGKGYFAAVIIYSSFTA